MSDPDECVVCGANPAAGEAWINDDRYCHDGTGDTCYSRMLTLRGSEPFAIFSTFGHVRTYVPTVETHKQPDVYCRVYFGSHGCDKERGHWGPHVCANDHDPYYPGWNYGQWWRGYYHLYGEDVSRFERLLMKVTSPLGWWSRRRHAKWLARTREETK